MSVSLDHGALDGAEKVPTAEELYRRGLVASTSGEEGALVLAHQWFNLAALQGNEDARLYRQQLTVEMSPAELAEAQKRARQWLNTRRAALAAV